MLHRKRLVFLLSALLAAPPALATDVAILGLSSGRAIMQVNGGHNQVVQVGSETPEGVKLLGIEDNAAIVEVDGISKRLPMGRGVAFSPSSSGSRQPKITIQADSRGQFFVNGSIDGSPIRFMVDTGATTIALTRAQASAMGVDYLKGRRGIVRTAAGAASAWAITLDEVRVGDITLYQIAASVIDAPGFDIALLGMSFLNRLKMNRDGDTLILEKRY